MKFIKDNKGVIWVWTVIILGIFVFSLVWFTVGYTVLTVAEIVETEHTYTGYYVYTVAFIKSVIRYGPILFLCGMAIWGYVNSQRGRNL